MQQICRMILHPWRILTLYHLGRDAQSYHDHDQSNQGWPSARRGNRSMALDLVTIGGVWLGAAGYRFRILDALHKADLCHSTLQSRDRDCPLRVTAVIGFVVGSVFAIVWNWFHKRS